MLKRYNIKCKKKLVWCRKSILDNHVILFQIFCLSCEYEIANKKPRFRMESVKKNTSMYKKGNRPKK
jgi:hypothetical protein